MELPSLGETCRDEQCKRLDFLSLRCRCGKVFCSYHWPGHVEICEQSRFLNKNELTNIDYNQMFICSKEGCKERSVVPLICSKCNKHYCVQHRHLCDEKSTEDVAREKERYEAPVRQFSEAKSLVDRQIDVSIAEAKKKGKSKEMAAKLQLMKIKSKARGQKQIPSVDRTYFNIHMPHEIIPVFVSKAWSLGRTIDAIADECKLPNQNNKSTEKKLRLFRKEDRKIISSDLSVVLSVLLGDKVLVDGDDLIINYVEDNCESLMTL